MVENEVKLRVDDLAQIRSVLSTSGFQELTPRLLEVNTVFDTPAGEIRGRGELLRLRKAGDQNVITFKGKAHIGAHKTREELEITVSDHTTCALILQRLGYVEIFRYEKYRTEFRRAGESGLVMLDETPIGTYLELEGTASWIDAVARELGYGPGDYVTSSYGALYLEYCSTRALVPKDMVFR